MGKINRRNFFKQLLITTAAIYGIQTQRFLTPHVKVNVLYADSDTVDAIFDIDPKDTPMFSMLNANIPISHDWIKPIRSPWIRVWMTPEELEKGTRT